MVTILILFALGGFLYGAFSLAAHFAKSNGSNADWVYHPAWFVNWPWKKWQSDIKNFGTPPAFTATGTAARATPSRAQLAIVWGVVAILVVACVVIFVAPFLGDQISNSQATMPTAVVPTEPALAIVPTVGVPPTEPALAPEPTEPPVSIPFAITTAEDLFPLHYPGTLPNTACASDDPVFDQPGLVHVTENSTTIGPWVTITDTNDVGQYTAALDYQTHFTLDPGETHTFDMNFRTVWWNRGDKGYQCFSTYLNAISVVFPAPDGSGNYVAINRVVGLALTSSDPNVPVIIDYGSGPQQSASVELGADLAKQTVTLSCPVQYNGVCDFAVGGYGNLYNILTGELAPQVDQDSAGNDAIPGILVPNFSAASWLESKK